MNEVTIGVVAPSFVVPQIELKMSLAHLRERGLRIIQHSQCRKRHLFFAGTDLERAESLLEYAYDPKIHAIWCARGGYGASRILSQLDAASRTRGVPPKKLLIGYSDTTALHSFVQTHWKWSTLHSPMPGLRDFLTLPLEQEQAILDFVQRRTHSPVWSKVKLKFISPLVGKVIEGELTGGNLSVLASLVGTPYAPRFQDRILFLEDVTESFYRLDRYVWQLFAAGAFHRVRAIVLGTFADCSDTGARGLRQVPSSRLKDRVFRHPKPSELKSLRPPMSLNQGLKAVFGELGRALKIPVVSGLPVGHGDGLNALPLGAHYRLTQQGHLELKEWDWLRGSKSMDRAEGLR